MPVQGYIEGRVVARVDVPTLRKNESVSGDKKSVSKKQALLRRQSLNKSKSTSETIQLPQSVFDAILNIEKKHPSISLGAFYDRKILFYNLAKFDLFVIRTLNVEETDSVVPESWD